MSRRPTYLRVVAWAGCPLRCPYCHREGDPRVHSGLGALDLDTLCACIEVCARAGVHKIKLLGGEPLLRPDLPELVGRLRTVAPDADLSIVTSGTAGVARAAQALDRGLDRINLSIHGWTEAAHTWRGGNARTLASRAALLELLAQRGLRPKLNYVYTGPDDDVDLRELARWWRDQRALLSLLDNLDDPTASPSTIEATISRVLGPWIQEYQEDDPHSLPAKRLVFASGAEVEVKSSHLRDLAPWRACASCPSRVQCREGTFALRLNADGTLQACMYRPDLALDLAHHVRRDQEHAAVALNRWLEELVR